MRWWILLVVYKRIKNPQFSASVPIGRPLVGWKLRGINQVYSKVSSNFGKAPCFCIQTLCFCCGHYRKSFLDHSCINGQSSVIEQRYPFLFEVCHPPLPSESHHCSHPMTAWNESQTWCICLHICRQDRGLDQTDMNISTKTPLWLHEDRQKILWSTTWGHCHPLTLISSSDGNVPQQGTSLHHHAAWTMVKWCLSVLHLEAGPRVQQQCLMQDDQEKEIPPCART